MTDAQWRAFLREGTRTGKLALVLPSGRPSVTPVWFILGEDDVLRFTTGANTPKARALAAHPDACLLVDLEEPPYGYVRVSGTVRLVEDQELCLAVATAAGARYMGPERAESYGQRNSGGDEIVVELPTSKVQALAGIAD